MTLAEQVAECEAALSAVRSDPYNAKAIRAFNTEASVLFPSLVARLREAESLLSDWEHTFGNGESMGDREATREFLKGRLSP